MSPSEHEKEHAFFQCSRFAVAGASDEPEKWAGLIVELFKDRAKDVIPVNPHHSTVDGLPCLKSVYDLSSPESTGLVIVTPPAVTLQLLSDAEELKIPMIWLQPGTHDDIVLASVRENRLQDRVVITQESSDSSSDSTDSLPVTPTSEKNVMTRWMHSISRHLQPKTAAQPHCGVVDALRRAGTTIQNDAESLYNNAKSSLDCREDFHANTGGNSHQVKPDGSKLSTD